MHMVVAGFSWSAWLADAAGHVAQGVAVGLTSRPRTCPDVNLSCPAPVVQRTVEFYVSLGGFLVFGVIVGYPSAHCRRDAIENDARLQVLIARQRDASGR